MNFLKTLGLVMVLVGYAMAGVALSASKIFHQLPPQDELDEDYYGESIIMRKYILDALYLTSVKSVDRTESPKPSAFEYTGGDGKSNVHHHDEETDGGYARVARAAGTGGASSIKRASVYDYARAVSNLYKISGNNQGYNEEEDCFKGTYLC